MAKATEHPAFGRLIPDQLGEDLMCFRKFSHLRTFWHPDSPRQLRDLEPPHRELVKKWETQPGELPQHCRNFDVLAALQSLGVYEVGIAAPLSSEQADSPASSAAVSFPTPAQVAAWEDFTQHEQHYCERACDALLRYYRHLREITPDLFSDEADCPENPQQIEDLQTCVRFDGLTLAPEVVPNLSTISFGWDVDWDMEHGLQMLFHNREVIAIGNDLYAPTDLLTPANFFRELFTTGEQAAYEAFARLLEVAEEL